MRLTIFTFCAIAASLAACSAGGGKPPGDAGAPDAIYEVSLDLPPGCPPGVENEKGVGRPCTMGGNQCGAGLQCACDVFLGMQLVGVPCLCTILTINTTPDAGDLCASRPAGYCGANASCCAYMNAATYCVPNICLADGMCPQVSASP